jgi:hypothetical protein
VPHKIAALGGGDLVERGREQHAHVIERARACGAKERFQLGKRAFDRIEVGTVGRQKPWCAGAFDAIQPRQSR